MLPVAAAALACLAIGVFAGEEDGWIAFALSMLVLAAWHVRERSRLRAWLEHGDTPEPPRARGGWDALHAALVRSRREAARREAELTQAVARWREAARALPDGVVILDGDRIAWCNDNASLHLEIDPARDVGTSITHLVRIPAFLEYVEARDYTRPIQVQAPHSDRALSLQLIAYGDDQRLVLSRDITQFRKMDEVRREFVANVSHELRTPLTVIGGFLETVRDEPDPAAARRYIDLMADQARRMERLVEDLLTLSSLESSPPPPLEHPVEMAKLIERLGAEARALSGGRHQIDIDTETDVDLLGSEKELSSAFGNLVTNAIRYTPEGGNIRLGWRRTEEGAAFEVEDTGIGIAPEHVPRLTERFYRVDRGRSRETGGTGLGLAIVKHALARHGAALDVASTPGKGSRFTARFTGARVRSVLDR
ncbi:MAG TPA: phosphate regulon sensor histidine kinase PhoR [Usitatibacter sp.]|nr:phosphate regulon sensor histidine kinase PhoR [Usitatibacter sp.]